MDKADIVELHVADAGGRDHMSEAMLSLCRRAATLEIQLEQLECCMSEGDDVDIEIYGRIASHLRRILETLGLQRKVRPANDGSNVLADYFAKPVCRKSVADE